MRIPNLVRTAIPLLLAAALISPLATAAIAGRTTSSDQASSSPVGLLAPGANQSDSQGVTAKTPSPKKKKEDPASPTTKKKTPKPTNTAEPTNTPKPTKTPEPTNTPKPTKTMKKKV